MRESPCCVHMQVSPCCTSQHMGICTSHDSLVHMLKCMCQMHMPTVPSCQSCHHANFDHTIMSDTKHVVIYRRKVWYGNALFVANAIALPHCLTPLELAAFFTDFLILAVDDNDVTAAATILICRDRWEAQHYEALV